MWALLVPLWKVLGLENNTEVQDIQQEHSHAVKWACNLNLPSCVHLANSLYAQWMLTPKNIKYVKNKNGIYIALTLVVEFLLQLSGTKCFSNAWLFDTIYLIKN